VTIKDLLTGKSSDTPALLSAEEGQSLRIGIYGHQVETMGKHLALASAALVVRVALEATIDHRHEQDWLLWSGLRLAETVSVGEGALPADVRAAIAVYATQESQAILDHAGDQSALSSDDPERRYVRAALAAGWLAAAARDIDAIENQAFAEWLAEAVGYATSALGPDESLRLSAEMMPRALRDLVEQHLDLIDFLGEEPPETDEEDEVVAFVRDACAGPAYALRDQLRLLPLMGEDGVLTTPVAIKEILEKTASSLEHLCLVESWEDIGRLPLLSDEDVERALVDDGAREWWEKAAAPALTIVDQLASDNLAPAVIGALDLACDFYSAMAAGTASLQTAIDLVFALAVASLAISEARITLGGEFPPPPDTIFAAVASLKTSFNRAVVDDDPEQIVPWSEVEPLLATPASQSWISDWLAVRPDCAGPHSHLLQ
jgi:hypothetical protein